MNKKLICIALLFFALATDVLMAQATAPEDLEAFVDKGMQDWHVPGAAVAVVTSKEVLFEQGFGHTTTKGGTSVNTHTLFAICIYYKGDVECRAVNPG